MEVSVKREGKKRFLRMVNLDDTMTVADMVGKCDCSAMLNAIGAGYIRFNQEYAMDPGDPTSSRPGSVQSMLGAQQIAFCPFCGERFKLGKLRRELR